MGVLEFISSLVWPAVVVGLVFTFRKSIRAWFSERPNKITAGPFSAEWDTAYKATVEHLEAHWDVNEASEPQGESREPVTVPPSMLGLELRDVAHVAPIEAVMRAWWRVEEELEGLALTVAGPRSTRQHDAVGALRRVQGEGLISDRTLDALQSLRRLRNIAAHGVEPISTTQALEFINLAEVAIEEIRPVRQKRELENALAGIDDDTVTRGRLYE